MSETSDDTAAELRPALHDYLRGDRGVEVDMKDIKAAGRKRLEQPAKNLDGWTEEALQAAIQEGLDDLAQGQSTDYDDTSLRQLVEAVKRRSRKRLKPSNR